ncbi:hypothetical protein [Aliikangiella coralliicola]|uniref:Uncharacterized protein n=1 Tax=Aliikangiella coralliicola TaxID=2592383 RepID=A0A545UCR1_9GAMM|nr:hypothetical protein [Aliikangiella coralliicola]TQV87250.1 hypothetical protein FLL46_12410 [Aliikangiella coralliicola]
MDKATLQFMPKEANRSIRKKNKYLPYLALFMLIFFAGCNSGSDSDSFDCPLLNDDVSWLSFGDYVFKNSGRDSTARNILSNCGWHVHNNHNGGVGNTLQIASPGEEIILVWAFNSFRAFRVSEGWRGQTERGISIGDDVFDLYRLYPGFTTDDGSVHWLDNGGDVRVRVESGLDGIITEITAGFYFRE